MPDARAGARRYAQAFFDLQLQFAHKVADLSGLPVERVLLEYTNLYVRFGLGRDFDPGHPAWQRYVTGLRANEIRQWTYGFYSRPARDPGAPAVAATSGCFSYARLSEGRIRLHFVNAETDGHSPLAADRMSQRRVELGILFDHVRRTESQPARVVGASWLYNVEAYRRLFPSSYLATAHAVVRFQHMPLWGQFLDRHGGIREGVGRLPRRTSTSATGSGPSPG